MKKNNSEILSDHRNSESGNRSKNFIIAPLDFNSSNSISPIDDILDVPTQKHNVQSIEQLPNNSKGPLFEQLRTEILDLFLDMRRIMAEEEDEELLILRKTIPLESNEEELQKLDPLLVIDYVRQLFFQMARIKNDMQKELEDAKEAACMDYEPQLQKLEAEVREHIRIEQQLKLYIESIQDKLDDLQKIKGKSSREEDNRGEYFEIVKELQDLKAKVTAKDQEIEDLKKELRGKIDQNHALELQVETVPILKGKIKELERIIEFNQRAKSSAGLGQAPNPNKESYSNNPFKENINNNYDLGRKQSQQYDPKTFATFESNPKKKNSQRAGALSSRADQTPETRRKEQTLKDKLFQIIAPTESEETGRKSIVPLDHSANQLEKLKRTNSSVYKDRPPVAEGISGAQTYRIIYDDRSSSISNSKKIVQERNIKSAALNNNEKNNSNQNIHKNSTQQEREKPFQKLKRNYSQDQGLLDNQQNKHYGKVTERELIQTYGRIQDVRPYTKSWERGTKHHNSTAKGSIDIEQVKQQLFYQNQEIERTKETSPPNQRIDSRSHSVDASTKNYRALRTKKNDDAEYGHITEIAVKDNRNSSKKDSQYLMRNQNL